MTSFLTTSPIFCGPSLWKCLVVYSTGNSQTHCMKCMGVLILTYCWWTRVMCDLRNKCFIMLYKAVCYITCFSSLSHLRCHELEDNSHLLFFLPIPKLSLSPVSCNITWPSHVIDLIQKQMPVGHWYSLSGWWPTVTYGNWDSAVQKQGNFQKIIFMPPTACLQIKMEKES